MAMDVPVALHVAQKAPPLRLRQALPELGGQMADESDHFAPVAAHLLHPHGQGAAHREHAPNGHRVRQQEFSVALHRLRPENGLPQRQEPVPRDGAHQRHLAALEAQGERHVHHGEPAADDQHRMLSAQRPRHAPGIMEVGRMMQQPARPRMHRGRRIAQGQHDAVGRDRHRAPRPARAAASRPTARSIPVTSPKTRLSTTPAGAARSASIEHFLQIIAVHRPRHEILGIRIGMGLADVAQEMQRIARLDR